MAEQSLVLAPLPWQREQWSLVQSLLERERLAHGLLLHGTAGVGKGQLARLLALRLLCESPRHGLPCGECHACSMFAAGSHPDFFLASAAYGTSEDDDDGKSRKGRKTATTSRQIRIDCIRDLIHFSHQAAHQGGRRVAIIEPAEWLNRNAQNALLKTLEEPGAGLFIILVSHEPSRLLATTRSRCQALLCPTPERLDALEWLRHHVAVDRAESALAFCHGAPLKALAAVHDDLDLLHREVMLTLEACRQDEVTYLFAAEQLARHDAAMVFDWWYGLLHRLCCARPAAALLHFTDQLLEARRKALGTANPNTRLLLESLLIDWAQLPA